MNKSINEILTILEIILLEEFRPSYIEVSYQESYGQGFIYILLSRDSYKYDKLSTRIKSVFEVLETYAADILKEYSFIVETFDSEELSGLFRFYQK